MKKRVISFLLILIATSFVLYFSLKDDYVTIMNVIFNINKFWLLVSFILLFGYYFFRAFSIYEIALYYNSKYKFKDALRLVLETNFFHAVTPFATGGQPYEIYSLSKKNIKVSDSLSISIGNFIIYQIVLVSFGLISIIGNFYFNFINSGLLKELITLGFVINFLVIVILLAITISNKTDKTIVDFFIDILGKLRLIKNAAEMKDKFHNYLKDFNQGSKLIFKNKKRFILLIIFHILSLTCLYLIPLSLFIGVGANVVTPVSSIIIMSYVMLIGSFVPIPGGTGGLEYGFVLFFGKFIKNPKLNAIMLLWRFVTYYLGMILGAIILNIKKEKIK